MIAGTTAVGVDTVSPGGVITSGPFGTGPVTISAAATISASGGARAVENPITLNANLTVGGSVGLTFTNGSFLINGANRTLTANNTADTTIGSNLTDDGTARTFTKAGAGRLILKGDNSGYLGPITASGGMLRVGSATALQANAVVSVNGNGTILDLNGFNGKVVGLASNTNTAQVALGPGTLTIANAGTSRNFTGVISGTGGVVISNAISQQIEGINTFSGGMLIQMGTVFLRTNTAAGDNITRAAGTGTITIEDTGLSPRAAVGANYTTGIVRFTNSIF